MQPDANVIDMPKAAKASPPPSGAGEATPTGGKGKAPSKPKKPVDWGRYNELMLHFALIYGTDTVIDIRGRIIMKVNALRLAFGTDLVKMWLGSSERRMILPTQLSLFVGIQALKNLFTVNLTFFKELTYLIKPLWIIFVCTFFIINYCFVHILFDQFTRLIYCSQSI